MRASFLPSSQIHLYVQLSAFENLQILHYIAIVVGIVLFVLSFFDFAGILYEIKLVFIAASLGLFAVACMMFYATVMAFKLACPGSVLGISLNSSNVFEAHDETGIAIVVLDAISALLLLGAAISFSRF